MGYRAHHIITTFSMSSSGESMLLSLLTYMRPHLRHTLTWELYQKEHYLTYRSDVIFEVPKCPKIKIFRGCAPDSTKGAYCESFHCSPDLLAGGEVTRSPIPSNPTPVLSPSIRLRLYGCQGLNHYRVVNRKYDYYTINTCLFLLASLIFLILKRLQSPT